MSNNMMKQIKEMQAKMERAQEDLKSKEVESSAGGDMVKVVMNGHQELKKLSINPEVVNKEDVEMLEDLVSAAINDAITKSNELASTEMGKVTGGLDVPGLGGLM